MLLINKKVVIIVIAIILCSGVGLVLFTQFPVCKQNHQTKDIYYVEEFLGHRSIKNTEIYVTIERTIFSESSADEFTVKVAGRPEEIKNLLEVGFEYICGKEGLLFFRKRK